MAPKRKNKKPPRRRDKIIERQDFASMELALLDYQNGVREEPLQKTVRTEEETPQPGAAPSEEPTKSSETPTKSSEETNNPTAQADESAPSTEEETKAETTEETPVISSNDVPTEDVLPPKTAHDPISQLPEEQDEAGSSLFWLFLGILLLLALAALMK